MEQQEKVIISLERYTELIQENAKLKMALENIKARALNEVEKENVNDSAIEILPKEKLIELLDDENKAKRYIWTYGFESLSRKYYEIISVNALMDHALATVIKIAKECLADKEDEE